MAVTKIWPIKDSLKRVVGYAKNPEKTEYQDIKNKFTDLASALRYAADPEKTGKETVFLVTGIHCSEKDPVQDMSLIKRHFGKTGGNVAYHAYQSFRPGEVTPEQCHEIGVRLAKELWGDRFQVLVATHLNCHHLHNHFVINSVSYADGKKFDCNKRTYAAFRKKSDELCREFDLSVVEKPEQKTPRAIHRAIQEGRDTRYSLMQDAIQDSLRYASSWEDFCHDLYDEGYEFEPNFDREHALIRRRGEEKWTRLDHTGYDLDGIEDRIAENDSRGFPCYEDRYEIFRAKNPDIVSKDPLADVEHAFRELSPVLVILAFLLMITTGRDPFRIFKRLLEKEKDLLVPVTPEMRETRTYLVPVSRQAELMV
ncbi:MAG: relaxase/mobilization nuclease domain-containing protein, partial [Clostridia bacterium]|nr:relaxase/mobilization nuclease domain-containing protein [Clostridia bacterium]